MASSGTDFFGFLRESDTKTVAWRFVGEGRGTFSPVEQFQYVGDGQGSFDKQLEPQQPPLSRSRKLGIAAFAALVSLLLVAVLFSLPTLPRGGGAAARGTAALDAGQDCEAGYASWAASWSAEKKGYCCRVYGRGCESDPGCESVCEYLGRSATCGLRIRYGASHRFLSHQGACARALEAVQSHCPNCGGCTLATAGCGGPG